MNNILLDYFESILKLIDLNVLCGRHKGYFLISIQIKEFEFYQKIVSGLSYYIIKLKISFGKLLS